tara:strand:- start:1415 stop:1630 length:216 start_codon:yes stop_codon:yes gene_type:complete
MSHPQERDIEHFKKDIEPLIGSKLTGIDIFDIGGVWTPVLTFQGPNKDNLIVIQSDAEGNNGGWPHFIPGE